MARGKKQARVYYAKAEEERTSCPNKGVRIARTAERRRKKEVKNGNQS